MFKKFLKYFFIVFLSIITTFSIYSSEKQKPIKNKSNLSLKRKLDSLIANNPLLRDVFIGIKILDLKTNKILYQINSNKLFRPASNQKLITTASALELLPSDFKFKTEVFMNGNIIDTILQGDLYIKGYGDPLFKIEQIDSLVSLIAQKSIKVIEGNLIGDVSYFNNEFWGRGWMWDDEPEPTAPFISPLSLNFNCINITICPGENIGDKAIIKIFPENDFVKIINNLLTTDKNDTSSIVIKKNFIDRENEITISGGIPYNSSEKIFYVSIREPEKFFLTIFKQQLRKKGIEIAGDILIDTLSKGTIIAGIYTPIDTILKVINKNSDNLSAENLFRTISAEYYKTRGTTDGSISAINKLLVKVGVDTNMLVIADGSGVSRYNLLSPDILIKIFSYFYQTDRKKFERLYNSLAIPGQDGTLKNRFNSYEWKKRVAGKTGTHSDVSALSGIYRKKSNELLAYSIIINHFPARKSNEMRRYKKLEEEILKILNLFY